MLVWGKLFTEGREQSVLIDPEYFIVYLYCVIPRGILVLSV